MNEANFAKAVSLFSATMQNREQAQAQLPPIPEPVAAHRKEFSNYHWHCYAI